ncbi:MAG: IS4 family transposase, partial [Terriglobia bacterium]
WIAVSVYVLVAILKKSLHLDRSLYTILQILSLSLFEKLPILEVLTKPALENWGVNPDNQLNLFDF